MKDSLILIIDSGATKTEFTLLKNNLPIHHFFAQGINTNYTKDDEIISIFDHYVESLMPKIRQRIPESVIYYGAGCANEQNAVRIAGIILRNFPGTNFSVHSDLMAACHAFCNNQSAIVAILGTGSSTCYYDGKKILRRAPSLGYMIGDEGSGTHLGKKLITAYLMQKLPDHLHNQFDNEFNLSPQTIIDTIYKKEYPNRFFASFAPFMQQHLNDSYIQELCTNAFEDFFNSQIAYYQMPNATLYFMGSVAFHFQELLKQVAVKQNYKIGNIIASPMPELVKYYSQSTNSASKKK